MKTPLLSYLIDDGNAMVLERETNKRLFYIEAYPYENISGLINMEEEIQCIRCGKMFKRKEYKQAINKNGEKLICCIDYPNCHGNVIDFQELRIQESSKK